MGAWSSPTQIVPDKRQSKLEIDQLDRQASIIAKMQIIGRGGQLLPEMPVTEPGAPQKIAMGIEMIIFAEDKAPGMLGHNLDMLTGREGFMHDHIGGRCIREGACHEL